MARLTAGRAMLTTKGRNFACSCITCGQVAKPPCRRNVPENLGELLTRVSGSIFEIEAQASIFAMLDRHHRDYVRMNSQPVLIHSPKT